MKLRSAPLEDVHLELRLTLEDDGGPLARTLLRLFSFFYRCFHGLELAVLRFPWRRGGQS